ncbi:MAG: NAD-binding protein, partial [Verrucomicrobiota bacterium]
KGDPTRESTHEQANFAEAGTAILQAVPGDPADSDNINLRICLTIEAIHPEILSVVECMLPENVSFFNRAGCDSVICIASLTGQMMVQELQDPGVGAIFAELTSNREGKQFYMIPLETPPENYGTLKEQFEKEQVIVLGIRRNEYNHLLPPPDFQLSETDQAILIATGRPS